MGTVVGVAVGGAVGALARWGLAVALGRRFPAFPVGTMAVNVVGSFLLGLLFVLLTERVDASPVVRVSLTTGLLGAFTTFSTFSFETFRLLEDGSLGSAAMSAAGNLGLGLVAIWIGVNVARAV